MGRLWENYDISWQRAPGSQHNGIPIHTNPYMGKTPWILIFSEGFCATNFTLLVFHFQLGQLGRFGGWRNFGVPHFPAFAFYPHNTVFSHTSKWFPSGKNKRKKVDWWDAINISRDNPRPSVHHVRGQRLSLRYDVISDSQMTWCLKDWEITRISLRGVIKYQLQNFDSSKVQWCLLDL